MCCFVFFLCCRFSLPDLLTCLRLYIPLCHDSGSFGFIFSYLRPSVLLIPPVKYEEKEKNDWPHAARTTILHSDGGFGVVNLRRIRA